MIPLDSVKLLVQQRLHVAAEEIFDLLERFISEHNNNEDEDTHCRLHTEHHHQHTLLDVTLHTAASMKAIDGATVHPHEDLAPLSPPAQSALTSVSISSSSGRCVESRLQGRLNSPGPATGVSVKEEGPEDHPDFNAQHRPACEEEVSPERQQMSSSPLQEEPESPHIKEEHSEEADWLTVTLLAVKREDNVRETEPLASTSTEYTKTQAYVECCGVSQPTCDVQLLSSHCSESDTEDIDEWEETREDLSALNTLKLHKTQTVDGQCLSLSNKLSQDLKSSEQAPSVEAHTGGRIFDCTVCGKRFSRNGNLKTHTRTHTGEKPFSCTVCGKGFSRMSCLRIHWRIHTGDKPFSCPVCSDKHFHQKTHLQMHMRSHTGENPFSCSVCGKGFGQRGDMSRHLKIHTGEKPFSCTICSDKHFTQKAHLQMHMRTHTREKPFSCTVCGKGFGKRGDLMIHMMIHTG